jgi:hypothetical protein
MIAIGLDRQVNSISWPIAVCPANRRDPPRCACHVSTSLRIRPIISILIAEATRKAQRSDGSPKPRSIQSTFFTVPEGKQQRTPRRLGQALYRVEHLQQPGDTTRVVVSAVVDVAQRPKAVVRSSVADVIVVRSEQNYLLLERWVAAFDDSQDIARRAAKALNERAALTRRLGPSLLECLDQVVPVARPPRLPAPRPSNVSSASVSEDLQLVLVIVLRLPPWRYDPPPTSWQRSTNKR